MAALRQQFFDQETAILVITRMAALKGEKIQVADVIYWLNNIMIKLLRGFSSFQENNPQSL